jgi:hypothetical protein
MDELRDSKRAVKVASRTVNNCMHALRGDLDTIIQQVMYVCIYVFVRMCLGVQICVCVYTYVRSASRTVNNCMQALRGDLDTIIQQVMYVCTYVCVCTCACLHM